MSHVSWACFPLYTSLFLTPFNSRHKKISCSKYKKCNLSKIYLANYLFVTLKNNSEVKEVVFIFFLLFFFHKIQMYMYNNEIQVLFNEWYLIFLELPAGLESSILLIWSQYCKRLKEWLPWCKWYSFLYIDLLLCYTPPPPPPFLYATILSSTDYNPCNFKSIVTHSPTI